MDYELVAEPDRTPLYREAARTRQIASLSAWAPAEDCTGVVAVGAHSYDITLGAAGLLHRMEHTRRLPVIRVDGGETDVDVEALSAELTEQIRALAGEGGGENECARVLVVAPWRADGVECHERVGEAAAAAAGATGAVLLEYPLLLWHWGDVFIVPPAGLVRVPLEPAENTAKQALMQEVLASQRHPDPSNFPDVAEQLRMGIEVFVRSDATTSPSASSPSAVPPAGASD